MTRGDERSLFERVFARNILVNLIFHIATHKVSPAVLADSDITRLNDALGRNDIPCREQNIVTLDDIARVHLGNGVSASVDPAFVSAVQSACFSIPAVERAFPYAYDKKRQSIHGNGNHARNDAVQTSAERENYPEA